MQHFTPSAQGRPVSITQSTESQVYALFGLAMGITVAGVYIGSLYAPIIMSSGIYIFFLIIQFGLILTSRIWMNKSPLNYILFAIFPLFSGFAITPLILSTIAGYANGTAILLNALSATAFMAASAAVFARTTSWNLSVMGRGLFFALIGLILLGLLQMFIPGLRTTQFELMLSGAGVVIFGLFTAYDFQRVAQMSRQGANPIMLALSLYLDIFNLFLYILRFMLALSGNRR